MSFMPAPVFENNLKSNSEIPTFLTFDDCQIVPKYSEINSRRDVDLTTKLSRNYNIGIPIVAAPMDTVCGMNMALLLMKMKGCGVVNRFMSIDDQEFAVSELYKLNESLIESQVFDMSLPIAAAVGVDNDIERLERILQAGANVIVVDVAHGHHIKVKNMMRLLIDVRDSLDASESFDIVAGSIATARAAKELMDWGADGLRVGVGGGSVCETRIRTGVGIPQLGAILDIAKVADIPVIADGGIRYPGDVAKALAAGADSVMIGNLLAGTTEAPGESFITGNWPNRETYKVYRGLASETTKAKIGRPMDFVEGTSALVKDKGSAFDIVTDILDGVSSAFSYVGAQNMLDYKQSAELIRITSSGMVEAHPHVRGHSF